MRSAGGVVNHSFDALDLEGHVILQDIGNTAR